MGLLEEGIVRSMNGLRDAEPDAERFMFVFPVTLMNGMTQDFSVDHESTRDGDVILFSRPSEGAPPTAPAREVDE